MPISARQTALVRVRQRLRIMQELLPGKLRYESSHYSHAPSPPLRCPASSRGLPADAQAPGPGSRPGLRGPRLTQRLRPLGQWGLSGTLIVVTLAWVCIRMLPAGPAVGNRFRPVLDLIQAQKSLRFALSVGALATSLACAIVWGVYGGMPTSVDEMAQLLHASALRGGRLTVPLEGSTAAWVIQNGVITGEGWASTYPPVHTILLAMRLTVGAAWIVGPIAIGVATALTTLSAELLLGVTAGRVTGLLLAVSPFWLLLGSTHLSHATPAAALSLVLWTGLHARDGGAGGRWVLALQSGLQSARGRGPAWSVPVPYSRRYGCRKKFGAPPVQADG